MPSKDALGSKTFARTAVKAWLKNCISGAENNADHDARQRWAVQAAQADIALSSLKRPTVARKIRILLDD